MNRDEMQEKVIGLDHGRHLVLAPAGCGKTHILAERVNRAIEKGLQPEDMLCLTFTNRASRGMRERIESAVGDKAAGLFIGNVHRFCSKFLFDNKLISESSCVLDENDTMSIIYHIDGPDDREKEITEVSELSYQEQRRLTAVIQIQHLIKQYKLGHPKSVFIANESDYEDNERTERYFSPLKFRDLCLAAGKPVSLQSIIDIYDDIESFVMTSEVPTNLRRLLKLMRTANRYERYKEREGLLDFEDLLVFTFDHAFKNRDGIKKYKWIQIDEVQDLSPLQIGIADLFTDGENVTLWLGDEQQAIFSFIGAKLETLNGLKKRCGENVHHLNTCYRSPRYLLDVFNDYAANILETDPDFLPKSRDDSEREENDLLLYYAPNSRNSARSAVKLAKQYKEGRTALLVSSNREAEILSECFKQTPHFKISGVDLFSKRQVKAILAHLNLLSNEVNYMAWARIIFTLKIFNRYSEAREFVYKLKNDGLIPTDFILYDNSCYLLEFLKAYREKPVVVFDTETTGLDVFKDDIVQIAAAKYEGGRKTGSLNILLHTDRKIPLMLGDIVNPLVEEYASRPHLQREEGLRRFIEFAKGCVLIGHNVTYDYNILVNNCLRDLPDVRVGKMFDQVFDSLKLARLVCPTLHSYKLKDLLTALDLEGENSHLADQDIEATYSLLEYCSDRIENRKGELKEKLQEYSETGSRLRDGYSELYLIGLSNLYDRRERKESALTETIKETYQYFLNKNLIKPLPKFQYLCDFIEKDVVDPKAEPTLYEQLNNHIMELNTFREADICDSSIIKERYFIATVHKAKGLEFDNVIVYGCIDDIYPFFSSKNDMEARKEDARKLYVAMTRAKRRLCLLAYKEKKVERYGTTYTFPAELSPFLREIVSTHPFKTVNE